MNVYTHVSDPERCCPTAMLFDRAPCHSGAGIFNPLWCELLTGSQQGRPSTTCPRGRSSALQRNARKTCSPRIVDCYTCKCQRSSSSRMIHLRGLSLLEKRAQLKSTFLLHRCGRAQRPDVAVKVVIDMRKEGIKLSSTLSNTYFKAKKVRSFLQFIGGISIF